MWFFPIGQSGEARRWRVCYQRGLPRLVYYVSLNLVSGFPRFYVILFVSTYCYRGLQFSGFLQDSSDLIKCLHISLHPLLLLPPTPNWPSAGVSVPSLWKCWSPPISPGGENAPVMGGPPSWPGRGGKGRPSRRALRSVMWGWREGGKEGGKGKGGPLTPLLRKGGGKGKGGRAWKEMHSMVYSLNFFYIF